MSEIDKEAMLLLTRDTTEQGRERLVDAVTGLFLSNEFQLNDGERDVVFDILRLVLHDLEMRVRIAVSEVIAGQADVPKDLIDLLVDDRIEVAYPILVHSPLLLDEDLIAIVRRQARQHLLAVAERRNICETVSGELVDSRDEEIICKLLENTSARIELPTLNKLVAMSRDKTAWQAPLLRRPDLPTPLAENMFVWVTVALRQHIIENFRIEPKRLDELLEQVTVNDAGHWDTRETVADYSPGRHAAGLHDENDTSRAILQDRLVEALSGGRIIDFLQRFENLTGIPEAIVLRAVSDDNCDGLAIALKSAGFGKALFAFIISYFRRGKADTERQLRHDIRRCMQLFDRINEESAMRVADAWKRNEDFKISMEKLRLN